MNESPQHRGSSGPRNIKPAKSEVQLIHEKFPFSGRGPNYPDESDNSWVHSCPRELFFFGSSWGWEESENLGPSSPGGGGGGGLQTVQQKYENQSMPNYVTILIFLHFNKSSLFTVKKIQKQITTILYSLSNICQFHSIFIRWRK